jgi:hypothetical protein
VAAAGDTRACGGGGGGGAGRVVTVLLYTCARVLRLAELRVRMLQALAPGAVASPTGAVVGLRRELRLYTPIRTPPDPLHTAIDPLPTSTHPPLTPYTPPLTPLRGGGEGDEGNEEDSGGA